MRFLFVLLSSLVFVGSLKFKKPQQHYRNIMNINDNDNSSPQPIPSPPPIRRTYPFSRPYYELQLKRLNSKNLTIQQETILSSDDDDEEELDIEQSLFIPYKAQKKRNRNRQPEIKIIHDNRPFSFDEIADKFDGSSSSSSSSSHSQYNKREKKKTTIKSENFEVITDFPITFKDVGGYEHIKEELRQCIDILKNINKYKAYNVRTPKGIILEGPPGNGKTLLAKGMAGEAHINFIAVSGSQFQEKYVGVGSSRVRELFQLASRNLPCIIFIDEIDAVGRARSGDGETSSSERDNTLNELLVGLDGFKNTDGIFLIGATNRLDLLDPALVRPGRIDKSIFIGPPNSKAREFIIDIHIRGKPVDSTITKNELVELTRGFSGAQIENLLNEAMLFTLRENRTEITYNDIDNVMNRMMAGWQSSNHEFTEEMINHIAVHEFGHVIVGMLCQYHSKIKKVTINLASPKSPAYTVFETEDATIYTKQTLFEHLMILLAGRIAEYEIFGSAFVSTGASNDFEESIKLAEKMVMYYGMGRSTIYPSMSEKYKEMIDKDVFELINDAYQNAEMIVQKSKTFIDDGAKLLKKKKVIYFDEIQEMLFLDGKSNSNTDK